MSIFYDFLFRFLSFRLSHKPKAIPKPLLYKFNSIYFTIRVQFVPFTV